MYINALSFYYIGRRLRDAHVPVLPRICEGLIFVCFNSSIPLEAKSAPIVNADIEELRS